MVKAQILIENEGIVYEPAILDGIQWSTDRKGSPGKLTFTAVNDPECDRRKCGKTDR